MAKAGNDEMLAAFLAIEDADAHVLAWRETLADAQAETVAQSVAARRAMSGASGIPSGPVEPRPSPAHRMMPDPYLTDAEYFEKRRSQLGPNVGKALVQVNMLELIGGLSRLTGANEDQIMAAAKFRQVYERAQIGGARALDYSAVKVDTSGPSEHAAFEIGEEARYVYRNAVQVLGMLRSSLVERVVVYDVPISRIASGSRARERMKQELFDALDVLAVHFRLKAKRAA